MENKRFNFKPIPPPLIIRIFLYLVEKINRRRGAQLRSFIYDT
jgi:hypothetical protein